MIALALLATVVWHYWIGVVIAAAAVATMLFLGVGYLRKVSALRYPRKR